MKPRRSVSEQVRREVWLERKVARIYAGPSTLEQRKQRMRDAIAGTGGGDRVLGRRSDGTPLTAAQAFQETYGEALDVSKTHGEAI